MSIRLRMIDGELVAICARYSEAKEDDLYLDDAQHYALSCKFMRDEKSMFPEGDMGSDEVNDALARKECGCPTCQGA